MEEREGFVDILTRQKLAALSARFCGRFWSSLGSPMGRKLSFIYIISSHFGAVWHISRHFIGGVWRVI